MSLKNWAPKIAALVLAGSAITLLFLMGGTALWRHNFRPAMWYLLSGAGLTLVFFRHRKIAFAITVLSFLIVNVGLTALFHPSPAGILITVGSIVGMYLLVVWEARRHPHLKRKDWKTYFDSDPGGE